jgi:PAS domain S-box-containing protein
MSIPLSKNTPLKLEKLIRSQTLPKVLVSICIITVFLLLGLIYFSNLQTHTRHQNYLTNFEGHLSQRLSNIETEVSNLAQNNLIINSLIDFDFQERSLPIFFQSIKLSVNPISIGFTDFKGGLVTSNNEALADISLKFPNWKENVLKKGEHFLQFQQGSLFIGEPILYAEHPEAALITYIDSLSSLIGPLSFGSHEIILTDNNNQILFSTKPNKYPLSSKLSQHSFNGFYTFKKPFMDWQIMSVEPLWLSYKGLLPLMIFLLLGITSVILTTIASVRIAAKQASKAVNDLQQTLATAASSFNKEHSKESSKELNTNTDNAEADYPCINEFVDIQAQFSKLLNNLHSTSMTRNTLAGLVDSLDEVLLVLSFDNKVILTNKRLESLLNGLNLKLPEDIYALLPSSFFTSKDASDIQECDYYRENFPSLDSSLAYKWQKSQYTNAKDEHIGFTFSGNNTTQEKAVETELLIKNKAIDEANTSIIIAESTPNGFPIIYTNKAFEILTGFTTNEVLGKECKFLQGPLTEDDKLKDIHFSLKNSTPLSITLTNYRKDGSVFQNQLTLSPIFDNYGNLSHVIGLQEDVSERVKTNAAMLEAQLKAEESAKLKSDFLASMSHEIRTPMNGVLGMLNILKETDLDKNQKQQLILAELSAESLLVIINDILDFSKIEAGKLNLEPIEFDFYKEINNLIQNLAGIAHKKGLELVVDQSGLVSPFMVGDPIRIKQVFTNLISNAIKFTESGSISISVYSELINETGLKLNVAIKDQGIGIPSEILGKIFETFTQADNSTTRKFGGTGLGLPISRQLCMMMGGDIAVNSIEGIGSEFSFDLNLQQSSRDFLTPIEYENKRVLILDSNTEHAHAIEIQLSSWGATVSLCDSINSLIDAFPIETDCLIFIDEQTLSQLDNASFKLAKSAFEALLPSSLVITTWEFSPYVNHSLFGNEPKHQILHFVKPITAKQLIECLYIDRHAGDESSLVIIGSQQFCFGKKILLVEDNHINQIVASNILETAGADVTIANNGLEAITSLKAQPDFFDLILMDCQMPEMDGYEASTLIRQNQGGEGYAAIPIIALTANALKGDKEKCIAAGMDDHVSKPINLQELQSIVSQWLSVNSLNIESKKHQLFEQQILEPLSEATESTSSKVDVHEKAPTDFMSLEIWNEAEMMHRISNKQALGIQLVEVFSLDAEDLFNELTTAYAAQDLVAIAFTAHTLKGIASNISGIRLTHLCAEIEHDAKADMLEKITKNMPLLHPMMEELKDTLEKRVIEWQA